MRVLLFLCLFWLSVAGQDGDITIAGFNIQNMGETKLSKEHIVDALATMMKEFDVTIIYEVQTESDFVESHLLRVLNEMSGRDYSYQQSEKTDREHYGIVFDPTKIDVLSVRLYSQSPDLPFSIDPETYFQLRRPLITELKALESGIEFTVIGMHSHLGKGSMSVAAAEAFKKATSFNGFKNTRKLKPKGEVQYQKAELDLASLAHIYNYDLGGKQNALIMGDFNADCSYIWTRGYKPALGGEKLNVYENPIFDAGKFDKLVTGQSGLKGEEKMYTNLASDFSLKSKKGKGCVYDNIFVAGDIRTVHTHATVHRFVDEINADDVDWDEAEFKLQQDANSNRFKKVESIYGTKEEEEKVLLYGAMSDHYPVSTTLHLGNLAK